MDERRAVRAVAAFEALKGIVILLVASGLTLFLHEDFRVLAERLVEHAHLNPAAGYPRIFVDAAGRLQDTHLTLLALGAAAYATLRFVEAYGLFRRAAWAEVLAAASGAIYVPFEIAGLLRDFNSLGVAALTLNLVVVAIMLWALHRRRQQR